MNPPSQETKPSSPPPRLTSSRARPWLRAAKWVLPAVALAAIGYRIRFAPIEVRWQEVGRGDVVAEALGTGTLEARIAATIGPKIQGRLAEVLVDQGDQVTEGQLLARLDDADWREQVAMAEAGLQAAVATVDRVRADEARARAVLGQARLSHDRTVELRRANVAAQADLDEAIEALRVAEAGITRAEAANIEAQRQHALADRTLRFHQARLTDTRLISPVAGLVVRRDRDPGDVAGPGNSVVSVIATKEMWVSAWVDETTLPQLRPGQRARVVFRSEPTNSYPGEVVRLGREADRETRELLVDVRVDALPANWAIGQRAEVHVATAVRKSTLHVPRAALRHQGGKPGVFKVLGGRARWTPVQPGIAGPERIEILEGLVEGDRVVVGTVDPAKVVSDGRHVRLP